MYNYRLIFPVMPGTSIENEQTADYESDEELAVGAVIEYKGTRWMVSQVPLEEARWGEVKDLVVWPAD
jgi:hypothetical protein